MCSGIEERLQSITPSTMETVLLECVSLMWIRKWMRAGFCVVNVLWVSECMSEWVSEWVSVCVCVSDWMSEFISQWESDWVSVRVFVNEWVMCVSENEVLKQIYSSALAFILLLSSSLLLFSSPLLLLSSSPLLLLFCSSLLLFSSPPPPLLLLLSPSPPLLSPSPPPPLLFSSPLLLLFPLLHSPSPPPTHTQHSTTASAQWAAALWCKLWRTFPQNGLTRALKPLPLLSQTRRHPKWIRLWLKWTCGLSPPSLCSIAGGRWSSRCVCMCSWVAGEWSSVRLRVSVVSVCVFVFYFFQSVFQWLSRT